jgi:phosphatidylserine synthase 2
VCSVVWVVLVGCLLDTVRGLVAVMVGFSIYCVLQLRDGLLVRPHPAFWRLIHGLSIMWMLLFVFLLFQNVHVARQWMKYLYSDLGQPLPATDYAKDCRIYTPENPESSFKNVKDVVFDEFIIAHSLGFWGNALMFRDTKICVFLSIFFEILEITFQHWMKNFMECWWDHVSFFIFFLLFLLLLICFLL